VGALTEQSEELQKEHNFTLLSYSSQKIEPKRNKIACKVSQNPYITDAPVEQLGGSPLKIRLSNNFTRAAHKISVSLPKREEPLKHSSNNFYCALEYDNSILQKKLQKLRFNEREGVDEVGLLRCNESKNTFKCRRNSQMNRKVEYQLNHTRYL
jgi:hypothetical protein